jgi:outer membrane protein TolC
VIKQRVFMLAALSLFLAGCTVGPNYRRPITATPPQFRGATMPADAASLADEKWFEVFKDEQLQTLIRTALEHNYDVREAIARVEAAQAALGITRSNQYTTVVASADLTTQGTARNGSFPLPVSFKQERTFGTVSAGLLSYEVDVWGVCAAPRKHRAQTCSRPKTTGEPS